MNRLFGGAGATLAGAVVGGYVVAQFSSSKTSITNTAVNRSRTGPKPRCTCSGTASGPRHLNDELQILEKGKALADDIHDAGIKSYDKNSDNDNDAADSEDNENSMINLHELNKFLNVVFLKGEIQRLEAEDSKQRETIASLEEKIGKKYMEMQTKLKELEDKYAELKRDNSLLAKQIKNLMNFKSAIIFVVTLVSHQAWKKTASLEQKMMQNDMELQAFADRLNKLEDRATKLSVMNSKLAQENKDLKHQISEFKERELELLRKVEQLSNENEELKNKVEVQLRTYHDYAANLELLGMEGSKPSNDEVPHPGKTITNLRKRRTNTTISLVKEEAPSSFETSEVRRSVSTPSVDEASSSGNIPSCSIEKKHSIREHRWKKKSAWLETSFRSSFDVIKAK